MKKTKELILFALGLLFITSCSNPKKEAFEFITADNKICGINMYDDIYKLQEAVKVWEKKYEVVSKQPQDNDGKYIEVNVSLTKKASLKINYRFQNGHISSVETIVYFETDKQNESVAGFCQLFKEYLKTNFDSEVESPFTFKSKNDDNVFVKETGNGFIYYCDFVPTLQRNKEAFLKKMEKLNDKTKSFILDYRDGLIKVPEDKIWILVKEKSVLRSYFQVDSNKTDKLFQYKCEGQGAKFKGRDGFEVNLDNDVIINGKCIYLIKDESLDGTALRFLNTKRYYTDETIRTIWDIKDEMYSLLPPMTNIFVLPSKYSSSISLIEIKELNLSDFKEIGASIELLHKVGLTEDNVHFVEDFNGAKKETDQYGTIR